MSQTVAGQLVGVLEQIGVKQSFGLIGDSLNPLADAVRGSQIEWVGVRHEEGAALAATGQAKLTGQLAVCAGTTGPGSNHLVAGLYEASRDHAPVLALSGEMPRPLRGTDYIQTTEPDLVSRRRSHRNYLHAAGARRSSGDRRRLCQSRRRAPDASQDVLPRRRGQSLPPQTTVRTRRARTSPTGQRIRSRALHHGGASAAVPPLLRALGPAEGRWSIRSGQELMAYTRSALDGRARHDRHKAVYTP